MILKPAVGGSSAGGSQDDADIHVQEIRLVYTFGPARVPGLFFSAGRRVRYAN